MHTPGESKKCRRLKGYGIIGGRYLFKTEIFTYKSKVNLYKKILSGSIPYLTDPGIRKMLVKGMFGDKIPHSIVVHDLP